MKSSFYISLVLLLTCVSCSLKITKDLTAEKPELNRIANPYFSAEADEYVYKLAVDAYGHQVGGILGIKNLGPEHYRLALVTEFGSTLLDMELETGVFFVHKVSEELNKKLVLKTLKNDFKLLLTQDYKPTKVYKKDEGLLYQTPVDNGFVLLRFNAFNELFEIMQTGKVKEKVFITFLDVTDDIARHILIDHANRKLTMDLKKIENTP